MTRVKFELPADDLERATRFYRDVFGWSAQRLPFEYVLVDTDGEAVDPADSDGGISPRTEFVRGPVLIIEVAGVDEVARKVTQAGGTLLGAKERVGDFGFSQYVKDSEGSVLCLWESIAGADQPVADADQPVADADRPVVDEDHAIADADRSIMDPDRSIVDEDAGTSRPRIEG